MDKPISTKTHGILDLVTVASLTTLPRLMKWSSGATRMLTLAGTGMLGYSLLTRYEFGLYKVLPMKRHLLLDYISGSLLAGAPFLLLRDETTSAKLMMMGMSAMELTVAALTQEQAPIQARMQPEITEMAKGKLKAATSSNDLKGQAQSALSQSGLVNQLKSALSGISG